MKSYRTLFAVGLATVLSMGMVACGSDTDEGTKHGNKTVSSLDLTPDTASMKQGEKLQYKLVVKFSDGTTEADMARRTGVEWISSDPAVATVSSDGMVTAVAAGTVKITARYGGKEESESLIVLP